MQALYGVGRLCNIDHTHPALIPDVGFQIYNGRALTLVMMSVRDPKPPVRRFANQAIPRAVSVFCVSTYRLGRLSFANQLAAEGHHVNLVRAISQSDLSCIVEQFSEWQVGGQPLAAVNLHGPVDNGLGH